MFNIPDAVLARWEERLAPFGVFLIVLALGLIVRRFVLGWLRRRAVRTSSRVGDLVRETISGPSILWALMVAVIAGAEFAPFSQAAHARTNRTLAALWIFSVTVAAAQFTVQLVRHIGPQLRANMPVTSLTENVARIIVYILGILILLNHLGITVAPILTALGVGGLAVALALQNTLSNLFAGIYMSLSGQVRPGDYIALSTAEEGHVQDITWRSTAILTLANNIIIVPNSKLSEAIITNYHLPEQRMALKIPVGVSYDTDPELVEQVLLEVAREAATEFPGILTEPAPVVRFTPGFGDYSLNFTLICQVATFRDQFPAQSLLRKRILLRFRETGIQIPFPVRTLRMEGPAPFDPQR